VTSENYTADGRRIAKVPSMMNDKGQIECPGCGCMDFEVTNTYPWIDGVRRRRKACTHCRLSFYTEERLVKSD